MSIKNTYTPINIGDTSDEFTEALNTNFVTTQGDIKWLFENFGTLEVATETKLGGILASPKTVQETGEVKIAPNGKLYAPQGIDSIPLATGTVVGGIKASPKTANETAEGKIGVDGKIYVSESGFGTPLASATTLATGTPATASVVASGPNASKVFTFNFGIPVGATGTAAGFGTPSATITSLNPTDTPTVNINSTGTNTSKVFSFSFGIPKGAGDSSPYITTASWSGSAGAYTYTLSGATHSKGNNPIVTCIDNTTGEIVFMKVIKSSGGDITLNSRKNAALRLEVR